METREERLARDPHFHQDLKNSESYVEATKAWYEACGFMTADYPKKQLRDTRVTDWHDLAKLDPVMVGLARGQEAKGRGLNFASVHEISKGYQGGTIGQYPLLIVDRRHHVLNVLRDRCSFADFYWMWSSDKSGVIWLNSEKTYKYWVCQWLRFRGRWSDLFMCPIYWHPVKKEPIYLRRDLADYRCYYDEWPPILEGLTYRTAAELEVLANRHRREMGERREFLNQLPWIEGVSNAVIPEDPGRPE